MPRPTTDLPRALALVAAALAGGAPASWAAPAECPATAAVAIARAEPAVVGRAPAAVLEELAAGTSAEPLASSKGRREALLGLHRPLTRVNVKSSAWPATPDPSGRPGACYASFEIRVELTASALLASEIPPGGCLERHALAHEMEHHRLQEAAARGAAESFATTRPPTREAFRGATLAEAAAAASRASQAYAAALGAEIERRAAASHAALDSPSERRQGASRCPADFAAFSRAALPTLKIKAGGAP